MRRVLLVAHWDWVLFNFRLPLAAGLRSAGFDVTLVCPRGSYTERLENAGYQVLHWPVNRRGTNPVAECGSVARLRSIYATLRPQVVHHFTIKPNFYGSLAAIVMNGGRPKVINTFTGLGFFFSNHRKAGLMRAALFPMLKAALGRRTNWTVFQNQSDLDKFVRYGLSRSDRVRLIPGSGVDTERFRPVDHRSDRGRVPVVLTGARLLWDKGIGDIVEAARILRQRGHRVEFVVAGASDEGNMAAIPTTRIEEWKSEGLVRFPGHQEDMRSLLHSSDIALLPSYHEGLPRFLLEASACGLPLIATDIPGCRAIVDDGVNGLVVPVRTPAAIADAVGRVLQEPKLAARLGQAGREKVKRSYSEERVVSEYLALYDLVCAN